MEVTIHPHRPRKAESTDQWVCRKPASAEHVAQLRVARNHPPGHRRPHGSDEDHWVEVQEPGQEATPPPMQVMTVAEAGEAVVASEAQAGMGTVV